jgi:hypothetical protein
MFWKLAVAFRLLQLSNGNCTAVKIPVQILGSMFYGAFANWNSLFWILRYHSENNLFMANMRRWMFKTAMARWFDISVLPNEYYWAPMVARALFC